MAENNAVCSICGKEYYACLSCHDSIKVNPWKMFTDTSEHYKVFQVVRGLSTKVYTKEEARDKLKNINLDDMSSFRPHIKKIIKDIIKEEKTAAKAVEINDSVDNTVADIAMEEIVVEKPVVSRKRSYRAEVE
jgi:uncharacterized CHY-type Zn-finger protein